MNLIPEIPGLYRDDLLSIDQADQIMKEIGLKGDYLFKSDLKSCEKYVEENGKPYIGAILISHAHLDHVGYLWMVGNDIPIYVSDITKQLFEIIDVASSAPSIVSPLAFIIPFSITGSIPTPGFTVSA